MTSTAALAAALERIPAIAAPPDTPQDTSPEPRESPQTASEEPSGTQPPQEEERRVKLVAEVVRVIETHSPVGERPTEARPNEAQARELAPLAKADPQAAYLRAVAPGSLRYTCFLSQGLSSPWTPGNGCRGSVTQLRAILWRCPLSQRP
jgi:hypothetical protein